MGSGVGAFSCGTHLCLGASTVIKVDDEAAFPGLRRGAQLELTKNAVSNRHKCFTDPVSWFGKPSSTVSESQASSYPHSLTSDLSRGQRHLVPCPELLYFSPASPPSLHQGAR